MPNRTPPVKTPVLFVGHGSPMNAIESNGFTRVLEKLGRDLPRPQAICVVSAHWITRGSQVLAAEWPRTIKPYTLTRASSSAASRCEPSVSAGYFTTRVRGIAGRRKLFEELEGVADGVAIKV
jgi:hypothetical protein